MVCLINDLVGVEVSCFTAFGIEVFDVEQMTEILRSWDGWSVLPKETTRIIFPGNGAEDVWRRLGEGWLADWQVDTISATRFWWPGNQPVAVVEAPRAFDFGTTDTIIIDDVVSSGATIQKIRERFSVLMPRTKWHAATWVAQRSVAWRGFSSHFASAEVGEKNAKVPIVSLLTLVESREVAESYVRRNLKAQAENFLRAIETLKQAQEKRK